MIPGGLCSIFYRPRTVGGLSVVTSVPYVSGIDTAGTVISTSVTATPQGGTGPYTYLWVYSTGDSFVTATSSTAATTTFQATLNASDSTSAAYYCQVTDSLSAVSNSNPVSISLHATGS